MKVKKLLSAVAAAFMLSSTMPLMAAQNDGSAEKPLRVILVPADGGTEDGTKKDFQPIFDAIAKFYNIKFDIKVGQSYGAVVEAMCNGAADIAWFGPASYMQAHNRGCADLLALAVKHDKSVYYSGIFARKDANINSIADIKGKKIALGDVNSTSSFNVPVAMMLANGVNPAKDAAVINMAGSHANVLKALSEGLVDVGGASFDSYEKAVNQKAIDPSKIKVVMKSEPLTNPPLAVHPELSKELKTKLKFAFSNIANMDGITKEQIRGYGGGKVDGYTSAVSEAEMAKTAKVFDAVTDEVKAEIMQKASKR